MSHRDKSRNTNRAKDGAIHLSLRFPASGFIPRLRLAHPSAMLY